MFTPKYLARKRMAALVALAILPTYANAEDAAAQTEDAVLPEVSVKTSKEAAPFRAETSSAATKTETELRDIPQSISVVAEELIIAACFSIARLFNGTVEVLRDASSVMSGRGSIGGVIDQVTKQADGEQLLKADVS